MNERSFWYIAAESSQLHTGKAMSVRILDEWIALFRGDDGKPVALEDRCLHRSTQISKGKVKNGCLQCPYHGWVYDKDGEVVKVPAEGPSGPQLKRRPAKKFATLEVDDYIYVNLEPNEAPDLKPFPMPYYKQKGWATIRLINRFENDVTNCVENFVDIPHTVFVHPTIFRSVKNERFGASVKRAGGSVLVEYKSETSNFGLFSKFLNAKGAEIIHRDSFHFPNITHVEYIFGPRRHFNITSQSVPLGKSETLVYTDLTYNYGIWNTVARPIIRKQGQAIIDQDIEILANQKATIERYGRRFLNSPCDIIHFYIESIRAEIEKGQDPRQLPDREQEIEFWV